MRTIDDLRERLFDTIDSLADAAKPMDIDRAKAIAGVAGTVIESMKVEVDFLRVTGGVDGTGFVPDREGTGTGQKRLAAGEAKGGRR